MNEDSLSDVDPGNPLPGISVANITLLQCRQLFLGKKWHHEINLQASEVHLLFAVRIVKSTQETLTFNLFGISFSSLLTLRIEFLVQPSISRLNTQQD